MQAENAVSCTWEDYLLLTLALEAAAAAGDWFEFQQLAATRNSRQMELRTYNVKPSLEETLQIQQCEERTMNHMNNRKREIAQELSKISKFKKR